METPRWLRWLVWLQVVIALVAIVIAVLAGTQIRRLIDKKNTLTSQVIEAQKQVEAYRDQVKNARIAVKYVTDGINLYHAGAYDHAVASYDEALNLDPENPYIYDLKGYSLFKSHKLEQSITALKKSVELDRNYAWGYFDLARSYCAEGKFNEAKQAAEDAIRIRPDMKDVMQGDGEFIHVCQPIIHQF